MAQRDIFISHIGEEKVLAAELSELLREHYGEDVGIFASSDIGSVAAGTQWLRAIEEALTEARIVIVLCSKESVRRPWIHFETGAGWIKKIPVIPVCHSGMSTEALPSPLGSLQAIELGSEEAISKLFLSLNQHLGVDSNVGSIALAGPQLRLLVSAERRRRRRQAGASLMRAVIGLLGLLVGPIAVATIYSASLRYYGGDADDAGEVLRFAPLPIIWYFGAYFRLSRPTADLLDYALAPLFIALLSGAFASVAYALFSDEPTFGYVVVQKLNMLTFVVSTALSFIVGLFVGEWLGRASRGGAWFAKPLQWLFPGAILNGGRHEG